MLQEYYNAVLVHLLEGAYLVDRNRTIKHWNQAAEKISGYTAAETVTKGCHTNILRHVDEKGTPLCNSLCPIAKCMDDGQPRDALVYLHHKQGHRVPVNIRAVPVLNTAGKVVGAMEIFLQHTQTGSYDRLKELARTAFTDAVTGLHNKLYMENRIKNTLSADCISKESSFGMLFFEVDNLKEINDEYGEATGDDLLRVVARTLQANIGPGDLACRWFSGRFMVLLSADTKTALLNWAHKLKALIQQSSLPEHGPVELRLYAGGTLIKPTDQYDLIMRRLEDQIRYNRAGNFTNISILD